MISKQIPKFLKCFVNRIFLLITVETDSKPKIAKAQIGKYAN